MLDWTIMAFLPHNLLGSSLTRLGQKDKYDQRADAPQDLDPLLQEELDFALLRGRRFKAS